MTKEQRKQKHLETIDDSISKLAKRLENKKLTAKERKHLKNLISQLHDKAAELEEVIEKMQNKNPVN